MATDLPELLRLFVAISVPEPTRLQLQIAQRELRRAAHSNAIRWSKPEQLHLTLKFLGDVEAAHVPTLIESLRSACQGFAPLQLQAQGVGFFPNAHAPRVVWAGLTDCQNQLLPLQAAVDSAVQPFSSQKPEGRFSGHVTLGRIRNLPAAQARALEAVATAMAQRLWGEWQAPHIELVRSQLSSAGPTYSTVATVALA